MKLVVFINPMFTRKGQDPKRFSNPILHDVSSSLVSVDIFNEQQQL